jgi:hypothetical protein
MGVQRFFLAVLAVGACSGGTLRSSDMRANDAGGGSGDAVAGTGGAMDATDVRVKADSICDYDLDAIPTTPEDGGDRCTFSIPPPPTTDGTTRRDAIRIIVDGVTIPYDIDAGWSYTDVTSTQFRLHGPSCDAIQAGGVHTIWVHFYCPGLARASKPGSGSAPSQTFSPSHRGERTYCRLAT